MLGFGFVELLLQISITRAKFLGEKYDLNQAKWREGEKQAQRAHYGWPKA